MSPTHPAFTQPGVGWSVRVQGVRTGRILLDHGPDEMLPTASIGKILLLLTAAEHLADGRLAASQTVRRTVVEPVADSGLWQHLAVDELQVADVARLVAAVSDNLATNVLIELVGLDSVVETASALGLTRTALLDIVRDERTQEHPPALSTGNAAELARLCRDIEHGRALSPAASKQVRDWLRFNTDLSMVASAFGLDPLAHVDPDRALQLWNKTGTNVGVRCDVGVLRDAVREDTEAVAYAVLARWQPDDAADRVRDDVLTTMREVGELVRAALL
jgi:beta-lactamase class A